MKKLLSLLLAITMIATMIPAVALNVVATEGTPATVVGTAEEFFALFGSDTVTGTIKLDKDYDLGGAEIDSAIATLGNNAVIDGDGHTVRNFTMNGSGASFALFNVVTSANVTIRNVTFGTADNMIQYSFAGNANAVAGFLLVGATTSFNPIVENVTVYTNMKNTTTNLVYVGVIAGAVAGPQTYKNVTVYGSLETQKTSNVVSIGALVGTLAAGSAGVLTVEGCTNYATVTSKTAGDVIGGLFGVSRHGGPISIKSCANYGTIAAENAQYVGGIIGWFMVYRRGNNKVNIQLNSCVNYGAITANRNAGGMVGYMDATDGSGALQANDTLCFEKCNNYGQIKTSGNSAGGMIGNITASSTVLTQKVNLTSCNNLGAISANAQAGGLIGYSECVNGIEFTSCVNRGAVSAADQNCGGLLGNAKSTKGDIKLTNCANYANVSASSVCVGGLIGIADAPGAALAIASCGNFGDISGTNIGGFVGRVNPTAATKITVSESLNMGNVSSANYAGGMFGYVHTTAMTDAPEVTDCINFGAITTTKGASVCGGFFGNNITGLTIDDQCVSAGALKTGAGVFIGGVAGGTQTDVSTAIANFNNDTEWTNKWGKVMLNDNGDSAVLATPVFVGVQKTNALANDGTYSIRLVSVIDAARYSKVGYKLQVNNGAEMSIYCTTAYTGISETVNGKVNTYKASDLCGSYVYALNVDDLDPNVTYTFTITPVAFGTEADGAAEYVGETYTFVYANGVFGGYVEEVQS